MKYCARLAAVATGETVRNLGGIPCSSAILTQVRPATRPSAPRPRPMRRWNARRCVSSLECSHHNQEADDRQHGECAVDHQPSSGHMGLASGDAGESWRSPRVSHLKCDKVALKLEHVASQDEQRHR